MKIKICGLFREADIDYVNEAKPDYAGFVFAPGKRQVSPSGAASLRQKLSQGIVPVGVFVNSPIEDIVLLYRDGVIDIAQLHGDEDQQYVEQLKEESARGRGGPVPVIKTISNEQLAMSKAQSCSLLTAHSSFNFYLIDSGAGSGKAFDWGILNTRQFDKPWFLAGGINAGNIKAAMAFNPFAIDVSSGAETDGIKDREKIVQLVTTVREGNNS